MLVCVRRSVARKPREFTVWFSLVLFMVLELEDGPNLDFQLKRGVEIGDGFWIGYPERDQTVRDLKLMTSEETKGSCL